MAISLFFVAVGAILTWAVTATASGLDVNTVGVILMIIGILGLVLSLAFWSSWGGVARFTHREVYVEGGAPAPPARRRTTYVEERQDPPAGPAY